MRARYVIDTNVLIAASAVDSTSSVFRDATPEDPDLRFKVHEWLSEFSDSTSRLVLDTELKILDEYSNKLDYGEFGRQVVIQKWSQCACDMVDVLYDENGYGCLDEPLATIIHDMSDRKLIAAALEAIDCHGECFISNAGDTDWYDWEEALVNVGVVVEQIIPDWSRHKWRKKKAHG